MKAYKISELIKTLKMYKRIYGDKPVLLSSDYEENSLGTVGQDSYDVHNGFLVLYPTKECIELEEVDGCEKD